MPNPTLKLDVYEHILCVLIDYTFVFSVIVAICKKNNLYSFLNEYFKMFSNTMQKTNETIYPC